jgi:subtilisin family serine protease
MRYLPKIALLILLSLTNFPLIGCNDSKKVAELPKPGGGDPTVPPGGGTSPNPHSNKQSKITGIIKIKSQITDKSLFARTETPPEGAEKNASGGDRAMNNEPEHAPNEIIIKFGSKESYGAFQKQPEASNRVSKKAHSTCPIILAQRCRIDQKDEETLDEYLKKEKDRLRKVYNDEKLEVFPNYLRHRLQNMTVKDRYYHEYQWNLPAIRVNEAWNLTMGTSTRPVVVAVIDTGVKFEHPDFQRSDFFVEHKVGPDSKKHIWDFISNPQNENDHTNGVDDNSDDPGDSNDGRPSSYHGTHVTGIIAATINPDADANSDDIKINGGIVGVAPQIHILPLRVLGLLGGEDWDIAQAIRYAAGLQNNTGMVANPPADVINLSLGGPGESPILHDAIIAANNAGTIVVAAAGNDNSAKPVSPASYEEVIAVGSVGKNDNPASVADTFPKDTFTIPLVRAGQYSNLGTNLDIMAPGGIKAKSSLGGIFSTLWESTETVTGGIKQGPTYKFYEGTSMAAPHVSGVVALMRAVYPEIKIEGVRSILYTTAIKPKDIVKGVEASAYYYGYGIVDAYRAVELAQKLGNEKDLNVIVAVIDSKNKKIAAKLDTNKPKAWAFSLESLAAGDYPPPVQRPRNNRCRQTHRSPHKNSAMKRI